MIIARTKRLIIRNWEDADRDLFFEINSDDQVMEYFPYRRTRAESDELFDRNRDTIATTGFGFYALEERSTGECLGFAGLSPTNLEPSVPKGLVEIGWRLAMEHWGKGFVTEAAEGLLELGFDTKGLSEIISFAVRENRRSTAVMRRIGMTAEPEQDFDHPKVPDSHPELKAHAFYRITRDQWLEQRRMKESA